jgi:thiamine pyrophosphokinase
MKEEKEKLNKLVSESRYQEAKDSLDLMKALHELRTEECK